MKYAEEMRQVQQETVRNRGRFVLTTEMEKRQRDYLAMLEARKRGKAPLYVTVSGKRYE